MATKRPAEQEFQNGDALKKAKVNGNGIVEQRQNGDQSKQLDDANAKGFFSKSNRLFDGAERKDMTKNYSSSAP